jgi:hypothetical protein
VPPATTCRFPAPNFICVSSIRDREEALKNVRASLANIRDNLNQTKNFNATLQDNKPDEMRIIVESAGMTKDSAQIKIEVSPVARGTLHDAAIELFLIYITNVFPPGVHYLRNWSVMR